MKECTNVNWFDLGKSDAMSGVLDPKTADYRRDCSQYGIQIKSIDYLKGFEVGLGKHCSYDNGFSRGQRGEEPHSLCEEVNPEFKDGYSVGLKLKKEESVAELKRELIEENGGRECLSSFECNMQGNCSSEKCERTGKQCTFDSDCEFEGRCESVSSWTEFNDSVSVSVCKSE